MLLLQTTNRFPSDDGDGLLMDKESEQDLLGVLPVDLPIKEVELLGLFGGLKQGQGEAYLCILYAS